MRTEDLGELILSDYEPATADFQSELIEGLRCAPKTIPCKFFYDERGSRLFDEICESEEYYVTRTETSILRRCASEISAACGARSMLVELGSGSSRKTRLLLDSLDDPVAYVPIDISRNHLLEAANSLNGDYFPLEVLPVCADYNASLSLPLPSREPERRVIFFPGSTIGNFEPAQAVRFLRRIANWCEAGDGLLIGVDLQKSPRVLNRAYNDKKGITAAFNLNLLQRANSELRADFNLQQFRHHAAYNESEGRIEMHLLSLRPQRVVIADEEIEFADGESVITEFSYKYQLDHFCELAASARWQRRQTWTDPNHWFSVNYFTLAS